MGGDGGVEGGVGREARGGGLIYDRRFLLYISIPIDDMKNVNGMMVT